MLPVQPGTGHRSPGAGWEENVSSRARPSAGIWVEHLQSWPTLRRGCRPGGWAQRTQAKGGAQTGKGTEALWVEQQ